MLVLSLMNGLPQESGSHRSSADRYGVHMHQMRGAAFPCMTNASNESLPRDEDVPGVTEDGGDSSLEAQVATRGCSCLFPCHGLQRGVSAGSGKRGSRIVGLQSEVALHKDSRADLLQERDSSQPTCTLILAHRESAALNKTTAHTAMCGHR